jgi:hypothetical protein
LEERHLGTPPIDSFVAAYKEFPAPTGKGWVEVLKGIIKGAKNGEISGTVLFDL